MVKRRTRRTLGGKRRKTLGGKRRTRRTRGGKRKRTLGGKRRTRIKKGACTSRNVYGRQTRKLFSNTTRVHRGGADPNRAKNLSKFHRLESHPDFTDNPTNPDSEWEPEEFVPAKRTGISRWTRKKLASITGLHHASDNRAKVRFDNKQKEEGDRLSRAAMQEDLANDKVDYDNDW
jgi:hypothetical protein